MSTDDPGARLAQRWVRLYTSRLPAGEADQRRAEILSDLWDHHQESVQSGQSELRHNLEVIERVLSGIPADVSWRRGIQRSQVRPDIGDPMTSQQDVPRSTLVLILLAGLGMVAPFPFLSLLRPGIKIQEVLWILGSVALAGLLAAGLALRIRTYKPILSTVLLAVGAFAPSAAWFWLPPVYLLTAVIIVTAVITARDRSLIQPSAG